MKIHSICPHLYADVRMGEDLQFTKQSVTTFKTLYREHKTNTKCLHPALCVIQVSVSCDIKI